MIVVNKILMSTVVRMIICGKNNLNSTGRMVTNQRHVFFSQKHLRCLGSRLVSLPGAPRYRRARFGALKWVRKTAGNVSGGTIVEIACGKHRWRKGTGSAMEEESWK